MRLPDVNWRLLVASVCAVFLVGALFVNAVVAAKESTEQANERRAASRERAALLQGQKDLSRRYDALLQYLETQGYEVPPAVLRGRTVTLTVPDSDNDDDDDDDTSRVPRPRPTSGGDVPSPDTGGQNNTPDPTPNPPRLIPEVRVPEIPVPEVPVPRIPDLPLLQ